MTTFLDIDPDDVRTDTGAWRLRGFSDRPAAMGGHDGPPTLTLVVEFSQVATWDTGDEPDPRVVYLEPGDRGYAEYRSRYAYPMEGVWRHEPNPFPL